MLIPIVGFRTEISTVDSTGLTFNYNFIIAFFVVAFVVGVRFLFHIYWFSKIQKKPQENSEKNKKKFLKKLNFYLGAAAAVIATKGYTDISSIVKNSEEVFRFRQSKGPLLESKYDGIGKTAY